MQQPQYDCSKCPGYCCTYDEINVSERDINRLAKHFEIDVEVARKRFTKMAGENRVLRHQKDQIYGSTIYKARPGVCHEYPERARCGYYDFLKWERQHQGDPEFIPLETRIG
jgi:Fe-S-cluster containining protein